MEQGALRLRSHREPQGLRQDLTTRSKQNKLPRRKQRVLEQRYLPVFVQFPVFVALLSDVVAYRVLVSMLADGGRKITICPKLAALKSLFHLRQRLNTSRAVRLF